MRKPSTKNPLRAVLSVAIATSCVAQVKPTTEYVRLGGTHVATIHRPVSSNFNDVGTWDPYFEAAHVMQERGITSGCAAGQYCPTSQLTREQMAAFIVRAIFSGLTGNPEDFTCGWPPVPCQNTAPYFADYTNTASPFYRHVQKLFELGITAGCSPNPAPPQCTGGARCFCPADAIPNGAVAVFTARARMVRERNCANTIPVNPDQNRANCDALITFPQQAYYSDVPSGHGWFKWIQFIRQKLVVTTERVPDCWATGDLFCPENSASVPIGQRGTMTRAQMAYYVVRGILGDLSY